MPATIHARDLTPDHAPDEDHRSTTVVIGLLFLLATGAFLTGDALVLDAFDGPVADVTGLRTGAALMALNALAVAGIGIGFHRVLRTREPRLALGHLVLRVLEAVVIIGIGVLLVSDRAQLDYEPIIYLFTGTAGLVLTTALARTDSVAAWLVRLGAVGYAAILAALPLALLTDVSLESFPGLLLYVPGAAFEVLLPVLLIARGLRRVPAPGVMKLPRRHDEHGWTGARR